MSIIANYEPKPVVPSNVKPVMTPSNNPEHFRSLRSRMTSRYARPPPPNKGMMLPGSKLSRAFYFGFRANCALALQLALPDQIYISGPCFPSNQAASKNKHTLCITS